MRFIARLPRGQRGIFRGGNPDERIAAVVRIRFDEARKRTALMLPAKLQAHADGDAFQPITKGRSGFQPPSPRQARTQVSCTRSSRFPVSREKPEKEAGDGGLVFHHKLVIRIQIAALTLPHEARIFLVLKRAVIWKDAMRG